MKKILFLAVALVMSVCSMWADIAPGTYVIRPYSAQSKCLVPSDVWFRTSDNQVKGPDKVVYTTEDPTSENGGYWVIANATSGGGFTITPENAKFVDTAGQHGYLNPWSGSSNVGCWTSTDGEDRWDITQIEGNVYSFESKAKAGNYFYYNSESSNLQYNAPGTPNETNRFVLEQVATPFPGAGTHYLTFKGKDSGRPQYLYHDLTQADGFTLASTTAGTTNAYIWRAVCDGTGMTIRNGQGQTIGMRGKSSVGTFTTDALTYVSHSDCYYLQTKNATGMKSGHNCLNQSNSSSYANAAGTYTVTSWSTTSGPNANDNHWYVTEVSGKDFYDVVITDGIAASDANYSVASYANFDGQHAANGGFFVVTSGETIETSDVTVTNVPTGKQAVVSVTDHTINITFETLSNAVDVTYEFYLGGEKIGEKVFTETIGQTPSMTTWFAALPASNYVNITSMHNDPITAESGNAPVQVQTAYRPNMPFKTDGTVYKLDLSNGTYYIYANSSADRAKETTTYGANNDYKWQMGGNWFTGFTFRNLSGYYIAAPSSAPTNGTNTQVPTELSDKCYFDIAQNGELGVRFKPHGGTNYLAHTSSNGLNVQFFDYYMRDSQFNIANQINFTEVPAYDWDGFSTKLQQLQQYNFGEGLGQYADVDLTEYYINGVEEALGLFADDFTDKAENNYAEDLEIMDYILANLSLNMPQAGQLLRMRGVVNTGKYLQDTSNNLGQYTMATEQGASSIFYFDGNHLLNYNTGLYTGVDGGTWAWAAVGAEGTQVTFHDASTPGAYRIQVPKGTGNKVYVFLYSGAVNASNADRGGFDNVAACTDTKYQWILEEVTTLPVTFKAAGEGYATLYSPVALTIPAGVTAYTLTEEENYLKANEITDHVIPAETGVVLESTAGETKDFTISDEAGTAEKGVLTGTLATIPSTLEDGNYVFSIAGATPAPGFYSFEGTTLAGFKAYYVPETPSAVQGFVLDFGGQTVGIEGLQTAASVKGAFDLQGRRVNAATRGLFIQNGVKVIR